MFIFLMEIIANNLSKLEDVIMSKTKQFIGDLFFLSNMFPTKIVVGEYTFQSSETLFQACKSEDVDLIRHSAISNWNGYETKKYFKVNKLSVRRDWHDIKLSVMWVVIQLKFRQNRDLSDKLAKVPDEALVELNSWNDTYWGVSVYTNKGENYLGRLLKAYKYCLLNTNIPEDCKFIEDLDLAPAQAILDSI